MKRVGFAPHLFGEGWLGGINYFRNLFSALKTLESPRIEPLLLVHPGEEKAAESLRDYIAQVRLPGLLEPRTGRPARAVARLVPLSRTLWRGYLLWRGIDLLSHSPPVLPAGWMRSLGFVYDMQHKELPDLFSEADRRNRDATFAGMCRSNSLVVVSSECALRDFGRHFPAHAGKARVLRFVANVAVSSPTPIAALRPKYELPDAFFYLPNQFWKHKNHLLVLDALAILRGRGKDAVVLATGAATDYRHPEYFAEFMARVKALRLERSFRMLGVVPYEDLLGLMQACIAVINPSLFEGWSTTIEEAKSLGKLALLSRIPVHLEQQPERSLYFDTNSPDELADQLVAAAEGYSPATERHYMDAARMRLPGRVRDFGLAYQALALEAMGDRT